MTMDIPLEPCHQVQTRNPLQIKVTLKKILEFVGTDHRSLLTCRLVASNWNDLAVEVLKHKRSSVTIGCDSCCYPVKVASVVAHSSQFLDHCERIAKKLIEEEGPPPIASVFDHLKLNLHVNFFYGVCAPQILRGVYILPIVHLQSLTLAHEKIPTKDDGPPGVVVQLLQLCALILEKIKYTIRYRKLCEPAARGMFTQADWIPMTFPKLDSISITLEDGSRLNGFLIQIVNSAPNLKILSFTQAGHARGGTQQQNLVRLIQELCPTVRGQVQDLTLTVPGSIAPDTFVGWEFSHVKNLTLEVNFLATFTAIVNNFLLHNFPLLTSYNCRVLEDLLPPHWPPEPNFMQWQRFPQLPNLKHFGFTISPSKRTNFAARNWQNTFVRHFLRVVAFHCTNISSVKLDLATAVQLQSTRVTIWPGMTVRLYESIEFPGVTSLHLNGSMSTMTNEGEEKAQVTDQPETMIRAMFPALTQVTINLERDIYLGTPPSTSIMPLTMRNYLSRFLRVGTLRHLILTMYYKRWLVAAKASDSDGPAVAGRLCCGFLYRLLRDTNHATDSGLEHLELRQPESEHWLNKIEPFHVSDLRALLVKFPELKVVDVDMALFRDCRVAHAQIVDQLRRIKHEFPSIEIKFL